MRQHLAGDKQAVQQQQAALGELCAQGLGARAVQAHHGPLQLVKAAPACSTSVRCSAGSCGQGTQLHQG